MYGIDSKMATSTEQVSTTTTATIEMTTATDPWMLFLYALKAPATKEKYIQRLLKFLDFLGYQGTKKEKACAFAAKSRTDTRKRLTLFEILPNQT